MIWLKLSLTCRAAVLEMWPPRELLEEEIWTEFFSYWAERRGRCTYTSSQHWTQAADFSSGSKWVALAVVKADSARGLTSSTYSIAPRCCFYSVYATATVVLGPASIVGRGRLCTPHFEVVLVEFKVMCTWSPGITWVCAWRICIMHIVFCILASVVASTLYLLPLQFWWLWGWLHLSF